MPPGEVWESWRTVDNWWNSLSYSMKRQIRDLLQRQNNNLDGDRGYANQYFNGKLPYEIDKSTDAEIMDRANTSWLEMKEKHKPKFYVQSDTSEPWEALKS